MEVEKGTLVMLPSGLKGFVRQHKGERVEVRYLSTGEDVLIKPQLLVVLTPYKVKEAHD